MSKYYDDGPFKIDQWNSLIRDVNDKLADPPDGCDPIAPLEEVEDSYLWAIEDVEDIRNKMMESCPDINFNEDLAIWKTGIIDEIESQLDLMWCDCEPEDCLPECLNAYGIVSNYCGILTSVGAQDWADYPDVRLEIRAAGALAVSKMSAWVTAWVAYCDLKKTVIDLQEELARLRLQLTSLEQVRDTACAAEPPTQCASAQSAVDAKQTKIAEKQADLDQAIIDRDNKLNEANGYDQAAEAAANLSISLADSAAICSSVTSLIPFIPNAPWVDYECDKLGPQCLGRDPTRCSPIWNMTRRITTHWSASFGGSVWVGTWGVIMQGGYTRLGTPYITSLLTPAHCNFACVGGGPCAAWFEAEYQVNQSFPFPTGEECCE